MGFLVEWIDGARNAAPEERATVADVRLIVDNHNIMQHFFDGELSDHVTIALYGLAHGLTHDWWSIFGGRDRQFSLLKYRSGYLLPDLRFWFDGAAFEVEVHQHLYRHPDVSFWGGMKEVLSRDEGEAQLGGIIEEILSRLSSKGIKETSAALRWQRVQASRSSDERAFCEAAGSLGLDPYQIDDETADFIEQAERIFEGEALIEFVAGTQLGPQKVKPAPLLDWVSRMQRHRGFQYRLADLEPLIQQIGRQEKPPERQPWRAGYRYARSVRRALNLKPSDSLTSYKILAQKLGAGKAYDLAPSVNGIKALRTKRQDGIQIHLRNQGSPHKNNGEHLFALARAVGDCLCFPDSAIAPINDVRRAYRQAAGRAFAAEFLAPIDEVLSMQRDGDDHDTIASHFAVSTDVIEHQIANQDRIAAACGA